MSLAPGSAAFATAAALPQALATLAPEKDVAWFNTHMIHVTLRDGTALWMQAMTMENRVWLRVTADASPRATTAAAARTDAIRTLRLLAYKVPNAQIAPLMSTAAGENLESRRGRRHQQIYPQEQSKTKKAGDR